MSYGVKVGLVRGTTLVVSPGIQFMTRSPYSHANLVFEDGTVWEAESEGFYPYPSLSTNNRGCTVDLFAWTPVLTPEEVAKAKAACEQLRGADYDFPGIAGFITRSNYESPEEGKRLFCSAAVLAVSILMGPERVLLARTEPWRVSPRDLNLSPRLAWVESVTV